MAGDWIKMRSDLHTHPKVVRIASALRADRLRVVGGLHAVWCLFDVHSEDGILDGYTTEALDDLIGFAGFSDALVSVGWLESAEDHLVIPRFDEHNGQSAKRRAQETQRKREARSVSAYDADKLRTREEKRREEIEKKEEPKTKTPRAPRFDAQAHLVSMGVDQMVAEDWLALRKKKNLAPTATAFEGVLQEAGKAGMTMDQALRTCCTRGWGGFDATWLDKGNARSGGGGGVVPLNRQEALERQNRKIAMEFAEELRHGIN
jgi:hypothetical protein